MAVAQRAVQWNPQKRRYDATLAAGVALFLAAFVGASLVIHSNATIETLGIRALGAGALLLLHVVLCIGPLCRLDRRFLPLLYNRRHLGVAMFALALGHALFAIVQFHALGDANPLVSVLVANPRSDSVSQFPFEWLGLAALVVFFLMAATSHDFWLAQLGPPVWKALHMSVYVAYALVLLHVALGTLQSERSPALALLMGFGFAVVASLHAVAGSREARTDRVAPRDVHDGFVDVCGVDEIPEKRAKVVSLDGERVAVFRYDGRISAVTNVCRHQNGPLGEGRIVDGCITCPWHGWQYAPATGHSPPPFDERIATFRVRVANGRVLVHPRANPPGTPVEPARVEGAHG